MQADQALSPADILRSAALDVVPYAHRVEALAQRLGLDLSATLFALRAIPLCLQREVHTAARRSMAELIAARTPAVRAALPDLVARHFAPLARAGQVEAMAEVLNPAVSELLAVLVEAEVDTSGCRYLSRVFSQGLGPSRRRAMEAELRAALAGLRRDLPAADDAEIGLRLSLLILGRDSLIGTLALSLHHLMRSGAPFASLDFGAAPPRTGVPYIDRVAIEATQLGEHLLAPGETLRAWLREYEAATDPRARLSFFGAGAHLCLGRALSLDLWREVAGFVTALPGRARTEPITLRADDVFAVPETLRLEVLAE